MQQTRIFEDDVLFLNIFIQDGKEAVKAKIEKRLAIFPASIKKQAARKASELTTPRMLAKQTGPKLMRKIPQSMKAKGVTIDMEEIFHEGPYMVFQLRVLHVDTVLLTRGVMEGFVDLIQWVLASVGEDLQLTIEREYLPKQILSVLQYEIPKMLDRKMKQKKMVVETKVLTDCEAQAQYFSYKVGKIRRRETRRQTLMRSLRRMSNSFSLEGSRSISKLSEDLVSTEERQ